MVRYLDMSRKLLVSKSEFEFVMKQNAIRKDVQRICEPSQSWYFDNIGKRIGIIEHHYEFDRPDNPDKWSYLLVID